MVLSSFILQSNNGAYVGPPSSNVSNEIAYVAALSDALVFTIKRRPGDNYQYLATTMRDLQPPNRFLCNKDKLVVDTLNNIGVDATHLVTNNQAGSWDVGTMFQTIAGPLTIVSPSGVDQPNKLVNTPSQVSLDKSQDAQISYNVLSRSDATNEDVQFANRQQTIQSNMQSSADQAQSNFQTALNDYSKRTSNQNPYRNKPVVLGDGTQGFVNNLGYFQKYTDKDKTLGENRCPNKDARPMSAPFDSMADLTSPFSKIGLADDKVAGSGCNMEGKNIYVSRLLSQSGMNATSHGCFAANSSITPVSLPGADDDRAFTYEQCRTHAANTGNLVFGLGNYNPETQKSACFVSDNYAAATQGGKAVPVESKSIVWKSDEWTYAEDADEQLVFVPVNVGCCNGNVIRNVLVPNANTIVGNIPINQQTGNGTEKFKVTQKPPDSNGRVYIDVQRTDRRRDWNQPLVLPAFVNTGINARSGLAFMKTTTGIKKMRQAYQGGTGNISAVAIGEHSRGGGRMSHFNVGNYRSAEKAIPFGMSFVNVAPGMKIVLYQHPNFKGKRAVYKAGKTTLGKKNCVNFNDMKGSFKVEFVDKSPSDDLKSMYGSPYDPTNVAAVKVSTLPEDQLSVLSTKDSGFRSFKLNGLGQLDFYDGRNTTGKLVRKWPLKPPNISCTESAGKMDPFGASYGYNCPGSKKDQSNTPYNAMNWVNALDQLQKQMGGDSVEEMSFLVQNNMLSEKSPRPEAATHFDPYPGCRKELVVNYACGNSWTHDMGQRRAKEGSIMTLSCKVPAGCEPRLELSSGDMGSAGIHIYMFLSKSRKRENISEYLFNDNVVKQLASIGPNQRVADGAKYRGRMTKNQMLSEGEYMSSKDGKLSLQISKDGKKLEVYIHVSDDPCRKDSSGKGTSVNKDNMSIYTLAESGNPSVLGRAGYVDYNGILHEYSNKLLVPGKRYSKHPDQTIEGTNFAGMPINASNDKCRAKCNASDDCFGYSHETDQNLCYLHDKGSLDATPQVAPGTSYYKRTAIPDKFKLRVGCANTPTKNVDSLMWSSFKPGDNMTTESPCDLDRILETPAMMELKKNWDDQSGRSLKQAKMLTRSGDIAQTNFSKQRNTLATNTATNATNAEIYMDTETSKTAMAANPYTYDKNPLFEDDPAGTPVSPSTEGFAPLLAKRNFQPELTEPGQRGKTTRFRNINGIVADSKTLTLEDNYKFAMWSFVSIVAVILGTKLMGRINTL